jgi:hypothetical protein
VYVIHPGGADEFTSSRIRIKKPRPVTMDGLDADMMLLLVALERQQQNAAMIAAILQLRRQRKRQRSCILRWHCL